LSDPTREVGLAYGACDGAEAQYAKRISYWIGTDGRVRKAYDKVDAARQPAQLLGDIEA